MTAASAILGSMSRVTSPDFVGRENELARLRELVGAARDGDAALVLVGGDAGIGKTRLVSAFTDEVDGARVLVGGCLQLSSASIPYVPLVEMLRQLARERGEDGIRTLLTGPRTLLRRLLPEGTRAAAAERLPDREAGTHLHEAVLSLLEALGAESPLVLVVEDLHWASASTLDLVTFLARNLPRGPVLLVATFRTDELYRRHPLRPVLAELGRLPAVERIDLGPFSVEERRRQVTAILGGPPPEAVFAEVSRRSEGNPFYAEELLAAKATTPGELPPTLQAILMQRLTALPDEAMDVLRVTAAAGRRVDHALLDRVAGLDPSTLRAGLRAAVDSGILLADGRYYRFRHALLQEGVHDDLLPGERVQVHGRLTEALLAEPDLAGDGPDGADAEIAHHAHEAMLLDRAYTASLAAAERAVASYAFADSLDHYERALAVRERCTEQTTAAGPRRLDILRSAAQAARHAGDQGRSIGFLRAAVETEAATAEERADVLTDLGLAHGFHGHPDRTVAVLQEALDCVPDVSPVRAKALAYWSLCAMVYGRQPEALAPAREAMAIARAEDLPLVMTVAANALGGALTDAGDVEDGVQQFRLAIDVAREHGMVDWALVAYNNLSHSLESDSDRFDDALAVAMEGLEYAEARGWRGFAMDFMRLRVVQGLLAAGDVVEADRHYAQVRLRPESGQLLGHHLLAGVGLRLEQGRSGEAADLFERTGDASSRVDEPQFSAPLAEMRARLALCEGRLEQAWEILDAARSLPVLHTRHDPVRPLAARVVAEQVALQATSDAVIAQARGRLDALDGDLRAMLADEPPDGHWAAQLRTAVAQVEAERTRALGEPDPTAWERAEEGVAAQGWVPEVAYLRIRRAEALVGCDRRGEATEMLLAVHEACVARGLVWLADQAAALARRARISLPGVGGADDPFGLTPREREVLALVARGLTNPQIGERLFIAGKTASVHVSNILAKLGAATRGEAAAIAHEHGFDSGPTTPAA